MVVCENLVRRPRNRVSIKAAGVDHCKTGVDSCLYALWPY